jgi:ComF family protein
VGLSREKVSFVVIEMVDDMRVDTFFQLFRRTAELGDDLLGLVYPRLCAACGKEQPARSQSLCLSCRFLLPRTDYHEVQQNDMAQRLTGRFPFQAATAMYYFLKDSPVQEMLHRIKYHGHYQAAYDLGRSYGPELKAQPGFVGVEGVVPVPLHPRREHQRGFNQSAWFGRGLAESLNVPIWEQHLVRSRHTGTQTAMGRQERQRNIEGAFGLRHPERLKSRHLLLVDDVMTTGATLEACATVLLGVPGVRLSLATIAIARD